MDTPHPEVVRIHARAFEAKLRMVHVCKRAGVARATWARMRAGSDNFQIGHIAKLDRAIDDLIEERAAAAAQQPDAGHQESEEHG